jgi:hypothetical protein
MRYILILLSCFVAAGVQRLAANDFTPHDITSPFGVQPFAGLFVNGGVSDPFFSDLSGLPFSGPGILDILAGLTAFDASGGPIGTFSITGVTVTQGTSFSPELDPFDLSSPVTYTSTLNPLNQVTVNPVDYNLAFAFNSDSSFQYSYTLDVSGVPDGGFLIYNDVEGALPPVPEPRLTWLLFLLCAILARGRSRAFRSRAAPVRPAIATCTTASSIKPAQHCHSQDAWKPASSFNHSRTA